MTDTVPGARKPTSSIKSFIKGFETCRFASYMPTPKDRPTIGWGTTGPDIRMGMIWNQTECDERFEDDIAIFAAGVDRLIGIAPTTQNQFDAMLSLAYNIGLDVKKGFPVSQVLSAHRAGRFAAAAEGFSHWTTQKGKVLRGLTRRREAEAFLYAGDTRPTVH